MLNVLNTHWNRIEKLVLTFNQDVDQNTKYQPSNYEPFCGTCACTASVQIQLDPKYYAQSNPIVGYVRDFFLTL